MRIFKNRGFIKFTHKERISDKKLIEVVKDIKTGKIDSNYGGGVIKQRIARANEGKSGGYRSIILFRQGKRAFFVYGFSKKDLENITDVQEKAFKVLAKNTLYLDDTEISKLIENGTYQEVIYDD